MTPRLSLSGIPVRHAALLRMRREQSRRRLLVQQLLLAAALLFCAASVHAQQTAPAVVEYITQRTLYLQLADGERWAGGDTVRLSRSGLTWLGRLRVIAATERRVAGEWLDGDMPVAGGDSVQLEVPALSARRDSAGAARDTAAQEPRRPPLPPALPPALPAERAPLRVYGSAGLDVAMLRSSRPDAGSHSSIAPATRLNAYVSGLPGGLRASASLRGTFYNGDDATGTHAKLHIYALDVEKEMDALQLRAGRFAHPHEPYAGFLDGVTVRAGRRDGVGAGFVYGVDARNGSEAWSTGDTRTTAFVDARTRRGALRWDAEAAVHRAPAGDSLRRTYLSARQHVGLGGSTLSQTLRVDRQLDAWRMTLLDLAAGTALARGWHAGARYAAERADLLWDAHLPAGWSHRASANLMWLGGASAAGADLSASWLPLDSATTAAPALALSSWADVGVAPGTALELSTHLWSRGDVTTVQVAPALRTMVSRARVRGGYRFYRAGTAGGAHVSHGADAAVRLPLADAELDVRLLHEQGGGVVVTRLVTGLWLRL